MIYELSNYFQIITVSTSMSTLSIVGNFKNPSKAEVLKLEKNHMRNILKEEVLGPAPEVLDQQVCGEPQVF